jgi:S1-C subfamily serine protease
MIKTRFFNNLFVLVIFICHSSLIQAGDFIDVVAGVKPSVVAIGTFQKVRNPAISFSGTGFVVGDGLTVITNAHVLRLMKNLEQGEVLGVLAGNSKVPEFRSATVVAIDEEHDLARLKISGPPLPSLKLGNNEQVSEGQAIAFTGFPLAISLGFHHATHRGFIASLTPIVKPASGSNRLDSNVIAQLRKSSFLIYQLDATAYPGNSGSPMYDPETGTVIGVINMVFIKGLKETAITHPSGISYAIPVAYVNALLELGSR